MKTKNLIKGITIMLLLISCKNVDSKISSEKIKIRVFNFTINNYAIFDAKVTKIEKNRKSYFVYKFDNKEDTLILSKDNFYFNNQILKRIDDKEISLNGKTLTISKYYYGNKKNYKSDKYLYLNEILGIIFVENLSTGNMFEYNIQTYHSIQKQIALNTLKYKQGTFELKYATRNYKDFKMKQANKELQDKQ